MLLVLSRLPLQTQRGGRNCVLPCYRSFAACEANVHHERCRRGVSDDTNNIHLIIIVETRAGQETRASQGRVRVEQF